LLPALSPLRAVESGAKDEAVAIRPAPHGPLEPKANLDRSDRIVAFHALQMALNELGDGMTLSWRRPISQLSGRIKLVAAFRNDEGRICRRVLYALARGGQEKEVEAVACREQDGRWMIAG
jgi:surface antigen